MAYSTPIYVILKLIDIIDGSRGKEYLLRLSVVGIIFIFFTLLLVSLGVVNLSSDNSAGGNSSISGVNAEGLVKWKQFNHADDAFTNKRLYANVDNNARDQLKYLYGENPNTMTHDELINYKYNVIIETDAAKLDQVLESTKDITGQAVRYRWDNDYLTGFTTRASMRDLDKIETLDGVIITSIDGVSIRMDQGANNVGDISTLNKPATDGGYGLDGKGTSVAIVDSGIDCTHRDLVLSDPDSAKFKQSDIESIINSELHHGVYCSPKVPYQHNYAQNADYAADGTINNDNFIDSNSSDYFESSSVMHGMHVAGIVGANDEWVGADAMDHAARGVAPEAQVLNMKVFSNQSAGAAQADIIASLIDCGKLGVDIVNMSLGGASTPADLPDNAYGRVVDKLSSDGVAVIAAAGNQNMRTNEGENWSDGSSEESTIGDPGIFKSSITVASALNNEVSYRVGKVMLTGTDGVTNQMDFPMYPATNPLNDPTKVAMGEDSLVPISTNETNESHYTDAEWPDHTLTGDQTQTKDNNYFAMTGSAPTSTPTGRLVFMPMITDGKVEKGNTYGSPYEDLNKIGSGTLDEIYALNNSDETSPLFCKNAVIVVSRNIAIPQEVKTYEASKHCGGIAGMVFITTTTLVAPLVYSRICGIQDAQCVVMSAPPGLELLRKYMHYDAGVSDYIIDNDGALSGSQARARRFGIANIHSSEVKTGNEGHMSQFSSWGATPDLSFKPDVTGIGSDILSLANKNDFQVMSGTSMATPYVAGCTALLYQYINDNYPTISGAEKVEFVRAALSNTTTDLQPWKGDTLASLRNQGSGLVNIRAAVDNLVSLTNNTDNFPHLELKKISKTTNMQVKLSNKSASETVTYKYLPTSIYYQNADEAACARPRDDKYNETYYTKLPDNPDTNAACKKNLKMLPLDGVGESIVADQQEVTLNPGESRIVNLTLDLGSFSVSTYIEGQVVFVGEANEDIYTRIPYMGFFGDYSYLPIIDAPQFCSKDNANFNDYVSKGYCPNGVQTRYGFGVLANSRGAVAGEEFADRGYAQVVDMDDTSYPRAPIININPDKIALKSACGEPLGSEPRETDFIFYANYAMQYAYMSLLNANGTEISHYIAFDRDLTSGITALHVILPKNLADGQYYFKVSAKGYIHETEDSFIYPVKIDNVKPVIEGAKIVLKQDSLSPLDLSANGYDNDYFTKHYYPELVVKISDNVGFDNAGLLQNISNQFNADTGIQIVLHAPNSNSQGFPLNYAMKRFQFIKMTDDGLSLQESEHVGNEWHFRFDPVLAAYLQNGENHFDIAIIDHAGNDTLAKDFVSTIDYPTTSGDLGVTTTNHFGGTADGALQINNNAMANFEICRSVMANNYLPVGQFKNNAYDDYDFNNVSGDSDMINRETWYSYCPSSNAPDSDRSQAFNFSARSTAFAYASDCMYDGSLTYEENRERVCLAKITGTYYKPFYYKTNTRLSEADPCFNESDRFGNDTHGLGAAWDNVNCYSQESDDTHLVTPNSDGSFEFEISKTFGEISDSSAGRNFITLSFASDQNGENRIMYDLDISVATDAPQTGHYNLLNYDNHSDGVPDMSNPNDSQKVVYPRDYDSTENYKYNTATGKKEQIKYINYDPAASYYRDINHPDLFTPNPSCSNEIGREGSPVWSYYCGLIKSNDSNGSYYPVYKQTSGYSLTQLTRDGTKYDFIDDAFLHLGRSDNFTPFVYEYNTDSINIPYTTSDTENAVMVANSQSEDPLERDAFDIMNNRASLSDLYRYGSFSETSGGFMPGDGAHDGIPFFECYRQLRLGATSNGSGTCDEDSRYYVTDHNDNLSRACKRYPGDPYRDGDLCTGWDGMSKTVYRTFSEIAKFVHIIDKPGHIESMYGEQVNSKSELLDKGFTFNNLRNHVANILGFWGLSQQISYNVPAKYFVVDRNAVQKSGMLYLPLVTWNTTDSVIYSVVSNDEPFQAHYEGDPIDLGINAMRDYDLDNSTYTIRGILNTVCYDPNTFKIAVPPYSITYANPVSSNNDDKPKILPKTHEDDAYQQWEYVAHDIYQRTVINNIELFVAKSDVAQSSCSEAAPNVDVHTSLVLNYKGSGVTVDQGEPVGFSTFNYYLGQRRAKVEEKVLYSNNKIPAVTGSFFNGGYGDAFFKVGDEVLWARGENERQTGFVPDDNQLFSADVKHNFPAYGVRDSFTLPIELRNANWLVSGKNVSNLNIHYLRRDMEQPVVSAQSAGGGLFNVSGVLSDGEAQIGNAHPDEYVRVQYRLVNKNGVDEGEENTANTVEGRTLIKPQALSDGIDFVDFSAPISIEKNQVLEFRTIDRYGNTSAPKIIDYETASALANTGANIGQYLSLMLILLILGMAFLKYFKKKTTLK